MRTFKLCFLLVCINSFYSCQKEIAQNLIKSTSENSISFRSELGNARSNGYDSFLEDTHSAIHFSVSRQYPFNNTYSSQAFAFFCQNLWSSYSTQTRSYLDVGQVSIGSLFLTKDNRNGYPLFSPTDAQSTQLASFQGSQVNFKITGNNANGYPAFSHLMYIPKPLDISFTHPQTTTPIGKTYITRNSSFSIKWTADAGNENGVLLRVSSNHKVDSVGNLLINTDFVKHTNILLLEDDGSHTFTSEDFNGINDRVELLITVIRGNAAIETVGEKTIKLYGREEVFANTFLLMP